MEAFWIQHGETPRLVTERPDSPTGFLWIDFAREDAPEWATDVERLTGIKIHPSHVADSLNVEHPSFYDTTEDYEMIVFRGLGPESNISDFSTRQSTVFLTQNSIITVRPSTSVSTASLRERLKDKSTRNPLRPAGLMHQLLSTMVDRFMGLREPLSLQIEEWQRRLLDPKDPFEDWMPLMDAKARLRRLEVLCEEQQDAILSWKGSTEVDIDANSLSVRISDLVEHVRRVQSQSQHLQSDLDALVQINFSAVAHRANEIMKVLTVVSAIFLPLTLIAGIWGMNFENMPELKLRYAYFFVVGGMVTVGLSLLLLFKKRRWI